MKLRRLIPLLALSVIAFACAEGPDAGSESVTPEVEKTESEKTYELRGVIIDRDPMANTLKVSHEEIGDWMGAMTMSFPVRGEDVQNLPEKGQTITATVHVDGTEFWLSDVVIADENGATDTEEPAPSEPSDAEPGGENAES